MRENGLLLNKFTRKFRMSELVYMWHLRSARGMWPAKANCEAVAPARRPEYPSWIQSVLGLVNFSTRFIPDFDTISEQLHVCVMERIYIGYCFKSNPFNLFKNKNMIKMCTSFHTRKGGHFKSGKTKKTRYVNWNADSGTLKHLGTMIRTRRRLLLPMLGLYD